MKTYIKLFSDTIVTIDDLTDEQAGQLFKAIKHYSETGEESLTGIMKAVFNQFKKDIDNSKETYEKTVERNKANGLKGGRPKTQKNPLGFSDNPVEPKKSQEQEQEQEQKNKYNAGVFTPAQLSEIISYRSRIKKAIKTQQAVTMLSNNFDKCYKAGYTFQEIFEVMQEKQWTSIELEWIQKTKTTKASNNLSFEERRKANMEIKVEVYPNGNYLDGNGDVRNALGYIA